MRATIVKSSSKSTDTSGYLGRIADTVYRGRCDADEQYGELDYDNAHVGNLTFYDWIDSVCYALLRIVCHRS